MHFVCTNPKMTNDIYKSNLNEKTKLHVFTFVCNVSWLVLYDLDIVLFISWTVTVFGPQKSSFKFFCDN